MKTCILFLMCIGLFAIEVEAQVSPKKDTMSLTERFERLVEQQSTLKSYYKDVQTADVCEAWYSCAKFAFEQYVSNQQFRVIKAYLKNVPIRTRRGVHKEKRLYIQVSYGEKIENIVFFTPKVADHTKIYQRISSFPAR